MNKILEKWEKTRLLEGLSECRKKPVAQCLEAQLIANKIASNDKLTHSEQAWQRISIPLVRRIFAQTNNVFSFPENINILEHNCISHKFKSENFFSDLTYFAHWIEGEAEVCSSLEKSLLAEINNLFKDTQQQINFFGLMNNKKIIFMWYEV